MVSPPVEFSKVSGGCGYLLKYLQVLASTRNDNPHHQQGNSQCLIYGELLGIVKKIFGVTEVIRPALEPLAEKIDLNSLLGT